MPVMVADHSRIILEINSLPPELQNRILRPLDLNDLARCSRVSRGLREFVHRVLSNITCIDYSGNALKNRYGKNKQFHLAMRNGALEHTGSFVRFITKYCPNVSSLVVRGLSVELDDIAALAPRLTFFSLFEITSSGISIDAKSLVTHFPNLQTYCFSRGARPLCPHEVMRGYSLVSSSQYAQYEESCSMKHTCSESVDVRSIESLQSISADSPLDLHELCPSSFNSLKFLSLRSLTLRGGYLPTLPNLTDANFDCGHDLNNVIRSLHRAPKLSALAITGRVDKESVPAVELFLSKCRALRLFTLCGTFDDEDDIEYDDEYSLDLSEATNLREFRWLRIHVPVEVILPSQCRKIQFIRSSVQFSLSDYSGRGVGSSYNFEGSSVSFREMSAFAHPLTIWLERPSGELIDRVVHVCPRVRFLALRLGPDLQELYSQYALKKMIEKTDVRRIILGDGRNFYSRKWSLDQLLARLFSVINNYPKRSISMTICGFWETSMKQLIDTVVTRPFHHESKNGRHSVEFPAAGDVLVPANSQ